MNLQRFKEKKPFIIIFIISLILIIGLLGGKWQQAYATTTVPVVDSITPNEILKNSVTIQFKIEGADFIGQWGEEYTMVRWRGPDGQTITVNPDSINDEGTEILVTFPYTLFTQQGIANVVVINHPDDPDLIEISQELEVSIIDFLYLPFLAK